MRSLVLVNYDDNADHMVGRIEVVLMRHNISCAAHGFSVKAPRTCKIIWQGLAQERELFHVEYANDEISPIVPGFTDACAALETSVVTQAEAEFSFIYLRPGSRLARRGGGDPRRGTRSILPFYTAPTAYSCHQPRLLSPALCSQQLSRIGSYKGCQPQLVARRSCRGMVGFPVTP